jgi:hypothetical protein
MRFSQEASVGGEHQGDPEALGQLQEERVVVDVAQVVQDDEQRRPPVAGPKPAEGFADLADPPAVADDSGKDLGVHVVGAEEGLGA